MDQGMFRAWLAEIDGLTAKQRQELEAVLAGRQPRAAVAAAIEERLGEARRCPHCSGASVGGGQADGLRRFRCKDCRRSFNALTGTPLARLRKKECWLDFGQSLSEGETVAASAERCGVAVSTAFRWRHRFLRAAKNPTRLLSGIIEVDETYILSSRKGERRLGRKARRRGGKAAKRGLSDEQTPILVAADGHQGLQVAARFLAGRAVIAECDRSVWRATKRGERGDRTRNSGPAALALGSRERIRTMRSR